MTSIESPPPSSSDLADALRVESVQGFRVELRVDVQKIKLHEYNELKDHPGASRRDKRGYLLEQQILCLAERAINALREAEAKPFARVMSVRTEEGLTPGVRAVYDIVANEWVVEK